MVEISSLVPTATLDQDLQRRIVMSGFGQRAARDLDVELCQVPAIDMANEIRRAELNGFGGKLHGPYRNTIQVDQIRELVLDEPPFDVLVNNAGTNRTAEFADVTIEDFDAVVDLNLRGAFFVAQAVVRRQIDAGIGGSIINVSSQMGHVGAATRTVCCASKHAIEGMTKAMAIDLAPYRIRVNTLCPTFVDTPMARTFLQDPAVRHDVLQRIKLGRVGQVEDLMGPLLLLASEASRLMTGSSVVIDGGWTAD